MEPDSRADQIAGYSFLVVFANDRTIDHGELAMLKRLALADGTVDEDERRVLSEIFERVSEKTVEADVWQEILEFKAKYAIP